MIIGNPGAGKSTLASKMGEILGLQVIHLDSHFWQPGWKKTPRDIWLDKVRRMAADESWIIDGTYDSSIHIRAPRADTIIFLDFPTGLSLWRILKRLVINYGRKRADMAEGCIERFDYHFIRYVSGFRREIRPHIIDLIEKRSESVELITLKSAREIENYINRLESKKGPHQKSR